MTVNKLKNDVNKNPIIGIVGSYMYEFSLDTMKIILKYTNSLYEWRFLSLPENFTLFKISK